MVLGPRIHLGRKRECVSLCVDGAETFTPVHNITVSYLNSVAVCCGTNCSSDVTVSFVFSVSASSFPLDVNVCVCLDVLLKCFNILLQLLVLI